MRTISEPARAKAATCFAVPSASAVSVLVIDCTTTGAPPPTVTWPTRTETVLRRGDGAANSDITISFAHTDRGAICAPDLGMRRQLHQGRRRAVRYSP